MKHLTFVLVLFFFFVACDEEGGLLIESDISEKQVLLIAPTNNSEIESNTVFFDWEEVEEAITYEVQLATPNFANASQLLLNIEDTIINTQIELTVGDYEWRVRAKNNSSETPFSSAKFRIIPIENFSDNTLLLLSPQNNLITNQADQTLEWQEIEGTTLYRIQLLQDTDIVQEQTTISNALAITFPEGNITWQVRAENGIENTLYSSRNLLLDITVPNTPQLTTPSNEATLKSADVTFEWTRTMLEGSMEFDSIYVYRNDLLIDLVVKDLATSPFNQMLDNDTYFWFVKAFDEAGNESTTSSTFSFTVNEP